MSPIAMLVIAATLAVSGTQDKAHAAEAPPNESPAQTGQAEAPQSSWTQPRARPMSAAQIARAVHLVRAAPTEAPRRAPATSLEDVARLPVHEPEQVNEGSGATAHVLDRLSAEAQDGDVAKRPKRASPYASIKPDVDRVRDAVRQKVESRTELLKNMSLFVSRKIGGERGYYVSFSELENKKRDMGAAFEFKKGDGMAMGMPSVGALVKKDGVIMNTNLLGGRF